MMFEARAMFETVEEALTEEEKLDVVKVLDVRQLMMEMRMLDATLEVVAEVIDIARGIVDVHGQKLEVGPQGEHQKEGQDRLVQAHQQDNTRRQ